MDNVLTVNSLLEFLLNLLRDEAAQAEFERDPDATLAKHGLDGLSAQDVRDVAPMLADHPAVHARSAESAPVVHSGGNDDPVREITYLKQQHEVHETVVHETNEYSYTYVDDRDTIVTVDDRDTTTITAEGDVTITDSFDQDNDVNVIEDSFNQDNDGVDNKGGTIEDSVVAGEDIEGSLNSDDDTTVSDSLNTDNSETNVDASDDDATETSVDDSFNSDDDGADIDIDVDLIEEPEPDAVPA
ncbi:MAG: IniB N-terminal domain-containing protein [Pseudonocardiaceae bacterium]